jgi:spore cortex formation protein SpoVR/YcgB (stage V sporulation)
MMRDIERVVTKPTAEDEAFLPQIAGRGDAMAVLRDAWANYRDDSFISQYLSPEVMRRMRLFKLVDQEQEKEYRVSAIHDDRGYKDVRRALSKQYDPGVRDPNIQVTGADLSGDRRLELTHHLHNDMPLADRDAAAVLSYVGDLWGFDVELKGVGGGDQPRYRYDQPVKTAARA